MSSDSIERELADYAATLQFDDLDSATIETSKRRLLDSIACAVAAEPESPVQVITEYASRKTDDTPARILTTNTETSVEAAALANSSYVRYLDWNDTYLSKEPGHPSDNVGAILAAADAFDRTGRNILLATVLAYELQCRLCDSTSLRKHGFDHVNYGLVSTTLAVGRLFDLSVAELTNAVRIAVNGHIALRQARAGELTEWKGLAFGNVTRNAVVAVQLADEGLNGPAPIFEGEFGFFNQVSGEFDLDTSSFGGNDGNFKINETYIKFYPVEYHAQAAVNCALDILAEEGIEWTEIEEIHNETYEAAVSIIADDEKWDPRTRETADHSMPYCIARAFVDAEMSLAQFSEEKVRDQTVRKLMDRIEIEENPTYTDKYGERFPHRMVVETESGIYERFQEYPKGHFENPLTEEELFQKFQTAAAGRLTDDRIEDIFDWIDDLESKEEVRELFALCKTDFNASPP